MDKIKGQAVKVGELLFASETASAYQKTLGLTWQILRETVILLWLMLCLLFVGGEWLWKTATQLGQQTRTWYETLSQPQPKEDKSLGEMGQSLLGTLQGGATKLLYTAKTQLGMDAEPPVPSAPTPEPPVSPVPISAPPLVAPSAPLAVEEAPPSADLAGDGYGDLDDGLDDDLDKVD